MDFALSFIGLAILVIIVFIIARFVLKLAGQVIGCIVTILVVVGIVAILAILL